MLAAFNAGEVSPLLDARVDLEWYFKACRTQLNAIPLPQGPVTRRPGFQHVAEVKTSSSATRLIPFEFSTTQAYIIEAGHQYFRFYKDKAQILSGMSAYEIASPYAAGDLAKLKWTQSADTLYLTHPGYAPRKLTRTGHTSWTLSTISFTAAPAHWAANPPACCQFHEERLFFAGSLGAPLRIDGSKSGDFENFTGGTGDDDAVAYTIAANQVNNIRWLASDQRLLAGAVNAIYAAGATREDEAITPGNFLAKRQNGLGSADVMPVLAGEAFLYLHRQKRKLCELDYSFERNKYRAIDVTRRAPHLTKGGLQHVVFQQEPWSVAWSWRTDGALIGFTYIREEAVTAWHQHALGGSGIVEDLAVIPGGEATGDQLWAIVRRTVNGATKRYIEVMAEPFDDDTAVEDAAYLDSFLTYSGASTSTISGLGHLEGLEVAVWGNGARQNPKTVASGAITLDSAVTKAVVGLDYNSDIKPARIEAGAREGSAQGRPKRINQLYLRVWRTSGLRVGRDADTLTYLPDRKPSDTVGRRLDPFTGDVEMRDFPGVSDTDAPILVRVNGGAPATILGLMPRLDVTESG